MRSCGSDNVHMRQRRPLRAGFVAGVCTAVAAEGGRARRAGTLARWGCRPIVRAGLRARRLGGRASPDGPLSSSRGSVPWRPQKSENLAWIWSTRVTRSGGGVASEGVRLRRQEHRCQDIPSRTAGHTAHTPHGHAIESAPWRSEPQLDGSHPAIGCTHTDRDGDDGPSDPRSTPLGPTRRRSHKSAALLCAHAPS